MSQWLPITEIAVKVQAGELKAVDLVDQALKTIADKSDYDAIIATLDDRAKQRAAEIDERIANGENSWPISWRAVYC